MSRSSDRSSYPSACYLAFVPSEPPLDFGMLDRGRKPPSRSFVVESSVAEPGVITCSAPWIEVAPAALHQGATTVTVRIRPWLLRQGGNCEATLTVAVPQESRSLSVRCQIPAVPLPTALPSWQEYLRRTEGQKLVDLKLSVRTDRGPHTAALDTVQLGQVARGERLVLRYDLTSRLPVWVPVWLGASLISGGGEFYNADEDSETILFCGRNAYGRFLTVSPEWFPGSYRLVAAVWCGTGSFPEHSVRVVTLEEPVTLHIT